MVASQHPLRSCLTQSPAQQFHNPKRIASCGWLLRNILFAVALLKALRSSSCCLAFLLFTSLQEHSLRSFVYSTHLYFEASFKSSFIS
jgi:hypothetical protein